MKHRSRSCVLGIAIAAVATVLSATGVRAENVPPTPPSRPPAGQQAGAPIPGDGRTPDQLRTEVLERMRALRAWRIVDALKLDEATSARLFPILSKYDDRQMALATERRDTRRLLRTEVQAMRPDDGRLTGAINRLLANRERQRAIEDDMVKELRKVLTPVQQAKLMLLLPRIEHEFAQRVQQAADDQRHMSDDAGF